MHSILFVILSLTGLGCTDPHDKASSASDSGQDTNASVDTAAYSEESEDPEHQSIMVVHLEPGAMPTDPITGLPNTTRASNYFRDLLSLIELADDHAHKITIMFSPQWAYFVSSSACTLPAVGAAPYEYQGTTPSDCTALFHAIEAHGHEIALHHHPLDAPSGWDGYTSLSTWEADRDGDGEDETYFSDGGGINGPDPHHIGDLDAMLATVAPLSSTLTVRTATTEEFHSLLKFSVAGGPEPYTSPAEPGDLLSRPCVAQYGENHLWEVRMRLFTSDRAQEAVLNQEVPDAIDQLAQGETNALVFGFVTHALNVSETGLAHYQALFSLLQENNIPMRSTQSVMDAYDETQAAPAEADSEWLCAD